MDNKTPPCLECSKEGKGNGADDDCAIQELLCKIYRAREKEGIRNAALLLGASVMKRHKPS